MRLLIADDHQLIRRGLRQLLHAQTGWQIVAEASSGTEAVYQALQTKPDVAVLDCYMPDFTGIEAGARILDHHASTKVIILTAEDSAGMREQAALHGISAVLLKSLADQELVAAIACEMAKQLRRPPPRLQTSGATTIDPLTTREKQILQMLASGSTSRQIAMQLGIGVRTVESHRSSLNAKCGFRSVAELVRFSDAVEARTRPTSVSRASGWRYDAWPTRVKSD